MAYDERVELDEESARKKCATESKNWHKQEHPPLDTARLWRSPWKRARWTSTRKRRGMRVRQVAKPMALQMTTPTSNILKQQQQWSYNWTKHQGVCKPFVVCRHHLMQLPRLRLRLTLQRLQLLVISGLAAHVSTHRAQRRKQNMGGKEGLPSKSVRRNSFEDSTSLQGPKYTRVNEHF